MEVTEKKRHKHLIKHSELIGRFDQFCDYTSVVGFRLLKSENPLWIRLLSVSVLIGFCLMVFVQTRDAFQRFINPASKPVPRFEASQTDPIPRPGFLICTEHQVASVMRGYGSIDFQLLLFEYIKEEPNEELFASVEREYQLLGFMFGTATDHVDEAFVNKVRQQLQHFPEIAGYLNFNDMSADPNILLQIQDYYTFSKMQSSMDECWAKNRNQTREDFVQCRWKKARQLFQEQFSHFNLNYFDYYHNVSLKFENLVLDAKFHNSKYKHEQIWHVEYGACELLKPHDKELTESEVGENVHDNFILRTNNFDTRPDANTYIFLYDSLNDRILNKINLASGEFLEIELTGMW